MTKIVIIGAGSGFGSRLSVDTTSREVLQDATVALCDIHPGRLRQVTDYVKRTAEKHNLPTQVVSSSDRRDLLPGADYVTTSVAVAGGAASTTQVRNAVTGLWLWRGIRRTASQRSKWYDLS